MDEDLLGGFGLGVFVGSFDELAGLERGAGADEREECFSKDPLHASGLDRFEFTILGSGGAGQPGPVTHYTRPDPSRRRSQVAVDGIPRPDRRQQRSGRAGHGVCRCPSEGEVEIRWGGARAQRSAPC